MTPAVSPSSLAAVSTPHPGSSRSAGASASTRVASSCSSSRSRRVRSMIRSTSSAQIRTCTVCSRATSRAAIRCSQLRRSSAAAGIASSGSSSCRCQRSRCWIRVRSATRSSRWSSNKRISRDAPSSVAAGSSGSRSAARATAIASITSDSPRCPAERRAPAISFGATRTTRSPLTSKNRSNDADTCRQSSSAHSRSSASERAQATSAPWPILPACTVRSPQQLAAERRRPRRRCESAYAGQLRLRSLPIPFPRWPLTRRQRTGLSGGVLPRSYQVTLALLGRRRATDRMQVSLSATARLRVSPPPPPSLTGASIAVTGRNVQHDTESRPV